MMQKNHLNVYLNIKLMEFYIYAHMQKFWLVDFQLSNCTRKIKMGVNNIKCSLKSSSSIFEEKLQYFKKYKTFLGKATLIVYGHSPLLINITGLKSMKEVETTRKYIEVVYNVKCSDLRVDNIFYSHKDCLNIDMRALYYYLSEHYKDTHLIDYNIELFPGIYMKSKIKGFPTIILFRTGSYTILGSKSIDEVSKYKKIIHELYKIYVL